MKHTVSIEIARPRERVAQLPAGPALVPQWLRIATSNVDYRTVVGSFATG